MKKLAFLSLLLTSMASSHAANTQKLYPFSTPVAATPATSQCWTEAAAYHGVDIWLLYSIASVESGFNPGAINYNTNGTVDLGMMQINQWWFPKLKSYGIQPAQLMNGCTSVYIGAWILSSTIKQYGYTWRAIGAYNSPNVSKGYVYAQKVYAAHRKITGMATLLAKN